MLNFSKTNLIFIVLLTFMESTTAQSDFSFRNISVKDGLSESTVKVIVEDHNGFIYIGTENGLDIYDGYNFKNYHMNSFEDNSLLGNKVSCIFEDSNNMIWIGTELGISVFNPLERSFRRPINPDDLNEEILADPETIIDDSKGNIWIKLSNSSKIYKHNIENRKTHSLSSLNPSISNYEDIKILFKDSSDVIWIGTNKGLHYINSENETINKYSLFNNNELQVNSMENGSQNTLWVGTNDGLIKIKDGVDGESQIFKKTKSSHQ